MLSFNFMSLHLYYPHFTDEETEAETLYNLQRSQEFYNSKACAALVLPSSWTLFS